jgi:hypothetical protein
LQQLVDSDARFASIMFRDYGNHAAQQLAEALSGGSDRALPKDFTFRNETWGFAINIRVWGVSATRRWLIDVHCFSSAFR